MKYAIFLVLFSPIASLSQYLSHEEQGYSSIEICLIASIEYMKKHDKWHRPYEWCDDVKTIREARCRAEGLATIDPKKLNDPHFSLKEYCRRSHLTRNEVRNHCLKKITELIRKRMTFNDIQLDIGGFCSDIQTKEKVNCALDKVYRYTSFHDDEKEINISNSEIASFKEECGIYKKQF